MKDADENFINSLSIHPELRTYQDIQCIRFYFKTIEALANYNDEAISAFALFARYENHNAKTKLYGHNDLCTSWYIVHSGCVIVEKVLFLPRKSFGHRSLNNIYRQEVCIILEDTELIVFDINLDKHTQAGSMKRSNQIVSLSEIDNIVFPDINGGDNRTLVRQQSKNDSNPTFDTDDLVTPNTVFESETFSKFSSNYSNGARRSHISDSSSNISSNDNKIFSSTENISSTSDEDSLYQDINSVADSFFRIINKTPSERSDENIETMLEGIYNLSAFSKFTLKTRQELCRVMNKIYEPYANVKIIDDGYVYDTWNVILTGSIEIRNEDGSVETKNRGDSFGVEENEQQILQNGDVWTSVPSCLFFSVRQKDFYDILSRKDEAFIPETEDNGRVSLVYEERNMSLCQINRVIVKGTPWRLCQCLIEDTENDPIFMENFLLTYRVFLPSPKVLAEQLLESYTKEKSGADTKVKATIRKCLVLWASNHFGDMDNPDADMRDYLEKFNDLLSRDEYSSQARSSFQIACSNNSKQRHLIFKTVPKNVEIPFRILDLQRGGGLFVTKVIKVPYFSTLDIRRGDQILKIGTFSWESLKSMDRVIDILFKSRSDSINLEVKYNPSGFQKMKDENYRLKMGLDNQGNNDYTVAKIGSNTSISGYNRPISRCNAGFQPMDVPKVGQLSTTSMSNATGIYYPSIIHPVRSPMLTEHKVHNNIIFNQDQIMMDKSINGPQVIKVYRQNVTDGKLILLTEKTTAKEAIPLIMKEFDLDGLEIDNYSLYLVTVEASTNCPSIKSSRVSDYCNDLSGTLTLNQRYYIKSTNIDSQLITIEQAKVILNEAEVTLNQLSAYEIATRLTFINYSLFRDIATSEYLNFIFQLPPLKRECLSSTNESKPEGFSLGYENYLKFENLINQESFWPATEICSEPSLSKRVQIIKKFIKVANICKCLKNFNSMMNIMLGLEMNCVSRLKSSWDKLPHKYHNMFKELLNFLNMEWNFRQIRQMESPQINVPPMIPWIALHSKDLANIHLANKTSSEDGMINFEKLRMMALEVRKITTMCSTSYSLDTILSYAKNNHSSFPAIFTAIPSETNNHPEHADYIADLNHTNGTVTKTSRSRSLDQFSFIETIWRKKRSSFNTTQSPIKNTKKYYEEWLSTLRVRTYLLNRCVEMDRNRLHEMSLNIEPPVNSPGTMSSSTTSSSTVSPIYAKVTNTKVLSKSKLSGSTSQNSIFESPLSERPQSIFSYQNLDDNFTPKNVVISSTDLMTRRKTIDIDFNSPRPQEIHGVSNNNSIDNTKWFGKKSTIVRANPELEDRFPDEIPSNLKKPVSDRQLESALTDRFYPNTAAGESINDDYYGEIKRQASAIKESRKNSRPQPSYNDNLNRINTHHDVPRFIPSRPLPPPRSTSRFDE